MASLTSEQITRKLLALADSQQGLTWRMVHDTMSRDNRVRAREAFDALTRSGRLHAFINSHQSRWFTCPARAAAYKPLEFNRRPEPVKPAVAPQQPAAAAGPRPVQYTVCPGWTHDRRYQIAPGAPVRALYASLPMGQYLEYEKANDDR